MATENHPVYFSLHLTGNLRTKSGAQIAEWLPPQVEDLHAQMKNWDWSKPFEFEMPEKSIISTFTDILEDDGLPDALPEVGKLILYDSSKLTDFIKGSFLDQYGFIVSDRAKSILVHFNLGIHKFYPLTLMQKGELYRNYWFFKSLSNSLENARRESLDLIKVNTSGTTEVVVSERLAVALSTLSGVKPEALGNTNAKYGPDS